MLDLLEADDSTLLARHGAWYLPRRDPDHLRRNALLVLGNAGDGADETVVATLRRYLLHSNASCGPTPPGRPAGSGVPTCSRACRGDAVIEAELRLPAPQPR